MLQYAGKSISDKELAKIYQEMPFAGSENVFSDLLIDAKKCRQHDFSFRQR